MFQLEKRAQPSQLLIGLTPVLAVIATMIAGGVLFAFLGKNPTEAIRLIFWDPIFGSNAFYYRPQMLIKAAPLILIAIGLSFGFKANIWNIGAEGQFIMGALVGGGTGLALYGTESWLIFPLMVAMGALGGFLWAMIPALLKIRFNANEILVSLMLVYVAFNLLAAMVTGPMRSPEGQGFPESRSFQDWPSAYNNEIITGSGVHWGVLMALGVVIAAYIIFRNHILGFHIRVTGQSARAATFSGVNPRLLVAVCLGISGALAGMAGLFEVAGPAGKLTTTFPTGYGFTAIIVAFLGRLHPVGITLAGLLMALTYVGGEIAQFQLALPAASIQVFQGMLLFFLLAVDVLSNYRVKLVPKERA